MPGLNAVLDLLAGTYGEPEAPPRRSVLDLVWLENVAYLVDDKKRAAAFNALRTHIGTRPEDVLNASEEQLQAIASAGILAENQADKLKRIASLAQQGQLDGIESRPLAEAKRALRKFPSIGEPGAEKILMLARTHAVLGLDSNGVRVLTRLGLVDEEKSYAQTYRGVQRLTRDYVSRGSEWCVRAYLLLREHGLELCKRSRPRCEACPLTDRCRYYARTVG
jgi:endonuclease-3